MTKEKKQTGFADLGHYDWEDEILIKCMKCDSKTNIKDMNECELYELKEGGYFICSDCTNKEMEKELLKK